MSKLISWTGWTKNDWKEFMKTVAEAIIFLAAFYVIMIGLAMITPGTV